MPYPSRATALRCRLPGALLLLPLLLAATPAAASGVWEPLGPDGVTASALAVATGEPPALYVALGDRLWTLPRNGSSWRPVGTQPPGLLAPTFLPAPVGTLVADPRYPERLLMGGEQAVDDSWTAGAPANEPMVWTGRHLDCVIVRDIALSPVRPTLGYAAADPRVRECEKEDVCALYRFEGHGATCVRGVLRPNFYAELTIDPRDPMRLWAAAEGVLWHSGDGGTAWTALPTPPFAVADLVADPLTPDRLHAADRDGAVWRSDDGGVTWKRRGPAPLGWASQLVVDPVEPRRLYVRSGGVVHASGDGGATWTTLAEGLPLGASVLHLALDPADPLTLYATVDGAGVWRLDRRLPPGRCVAGPRTLCLGEGGRFRLRVVWRDHRGLAGRGGAAPLTADTGAFWFFRPGNRELVVKVLDGRPVNGFHWVFYASLTNVPFTLLVTDTATGETQGYHNPEGLFASRGDTAAFPEGTPHVFPGPWPPHEPVQRDVVGAEPCLPGPHVLCLGDGRFRAEVEWQLVIGGAGRGRAVPDEGSGDSGYFWFFQPDNLELAVKVLDGVPVNGFHWVFYGSLTNVAFRLRVTDTRTGGRVTYVNPGGVMASSGDTAAFFGP